MNKFKKWLLQNIRREYKVVYIATGFMGNKYNAGIFKFKVSDRHLNKHGVTAHVYGFMLNKSSLTKHFKVRKDGHIAFLSANMKE
tara:strand:+ start:217 stop:471 length:255 start_codon:yes stop_codon:yes gene_type:complete